MSRLKSILLVSAAVLIFVSIVAAESGNAPKKKADAARFASNTAPKRSIHGALDESLLPLMVENYGGSPLRTVEEQKFAEAFSASENTLRRIYSSGGQSFVVIVIRAASPSESYALFTRIARQRRDGAVAARGIEFNNIGTADFIVNDGEVVFYKGAALVGIKAENAASSDNLVRFARAVAANVKVNDPSLPVLLAHLPDAERVRGGADYATNSETLKAAVGERPVLDALSFDGGTEAVAARYPTGALLVIAEHTTPQFAADNGEKINARIQELRAAGQPVPAFKRIGNYSVFVFDARDDAEANWFFNNVKYEKDVRWLGYNPHAFDQANRAYSAMTVGILVATLKTTGLSILLCLALGGLVGGAIFWRRRAQQAELSAFSDAGGMVRLNIDDVTKQLGSASPLKRGDE